MGNDRVDELPPMVKTGLRLVKGSWKMNPISRPLTRRIPPEEACRCDLPRSVICPAVRRSGGVRRSTIAAPVSDFRPRIPRRDQGLRRRDRKARSIQCDEDRGCPEAARSSNLVPRVAVLSSTQSQPWIKDIPEVIPEYIGGNHECRRGRDRATPRSTIRRIEDSCCRFG